ncbi:ATP-binding protein, partial [Streptomyces sp. NPDC054838]
MNVTNEPALVRDRFYPRSRQTIAAARHFTAETLDAWDALARLDDVLLCVSELATNALLHGVPPGRGYRLRLFRFDGVVRVEMHDSG